MAPRGQRLGLENGTLMLGAPKSGVKERRWYWCCQEVVTAVGGSERMRCRRGRNEIEETMANGRGVS